MGDSAFNVEETGQSLKISVWPQRSDRLRLIISMALVLCAAAVPAGVAVVIASQLGVAAAIATILLIGVTGVLVIVRMLILAALSGKQTIIEIGHTNMTVESPQFLLGKKVFGRKALRSITVKTIMGPLAAIEIRCGYDEPVHVLLGHGEAQLTRIAERINIALDKPL
jgi:hypothetical protein